MRCFQRRVRAWRVDLILAFDTEWLADDALAAAVALTSVPATVAQEALAAAATGC